jgi:hypothetical protein
MGDSMLNSAITKCSGRGLGLFNQGDEPSFIRLGRTGVWQYVWRLERQRRF